MRYVVLCLIPQNCNITIIPKVSWTLRHETRTNVFSKQPYFVYLFMEQLVLLLPYCSVSPWTSFTHSFCSLSDRQMTLVGGGVEGLSYTLWTPGGSSRQNLPDKMKYFTCNSCLMLYTDTKTSCVLGKAKQTGVLHLLARFHHLILCSFCRVSMRLRPFPST